MLENHAGVEWLWKGGHALRGDLESVLERVHKIISEHKIGPNIFVSQRNNLRSFASLCYAGISIDLLQYHSMDSNRVTARAF